MADLKAMEAEIARLTAENAKMKAENETAVTLKLGQKGTVCMYHGGRWPLSLYASQWERIIDFIKAGKVEAFIKANEDKVARKAKS